MKKLEDWTEQYYNQIEHYFWTPQDFGRKSNQKNLPWSHWLTKLKNDETPLNHLLSQLLVMMPQSFTQHILSSVLVRTIDKFQVVHPYSSDAPLKGVIQPDLTFESKNGLVFIEMKVDSESSIDQFVKYAIAASIYEKAFGKYETIDLVMLGKSKDFKQFFRPIQLLPNEAALRQQANRGIDGEHVWKQASAKNYIENASPEDLQELKKVLEKMKLHLIDYQTIGESALQYQSPDETSEKILKYFLLELSTRNLFKTN